MLPMNLWYINTNGNFVQLEHKKQQDLSPGEAGIPLRGQNSVFRSLLHGLFVCFAFRATK